MSTTTISTGDTVWVGQPAPTKVTWTVQGIHQNGDGGHYATLRSGHYGRSWLVPVERLVLHTGEEFA